MLDIYINKCPLKHLRAFILCYFLVYLFDNYEKLLNKRIFRIYIFLKSVDQRNNYPQILIINKTFIQKIT